MEMFYSLQILPPEVLQTSASVILLKLGIAPKVGYRKFLWKVNRSEKDGSFC